jgi:hypothetical protein
MFGSVTHQTAAFGHFTQRIGRREPVERRQLDQLDAPPNEERRGRDEQGIGSLARHGLESRVDLAAGVGVEHLDLQPHGASSRFRVSQRGFRNRTISRIDEHSNASGLGHQLTQQLQPLCRQLGGEQIDTRQVAAWPGEARDETDLTGSSPTRKTMGIVVVAALAANVAVLTVVAITARTSSAANSGN